MWWYSIAVLVLWVVNPELRRLYDWRFGFAAVEFISLLPLLAMVPHIYSLTLGGGWQRLPRPLAIAGWCWFGGFAYALFLAMLSNNLIAASYAFANFIFPAALGLWLAADQTDRAVVYARISRVVFILTTFVSVYAIIQYVIVPPWDGLWLQNVIAHGETSFGRPVPFEIRVFSVLNSPGPFGNYMALALLIALPELCRGRPLALIQIPIWLVAFGLSLDRSGWLLFAVGGVIYLILAPRRLALIFTTAISAMALFATMTFLPTLTGNETVISTLTSRFATFSKLDEDESGAARLDTYSQAGTLISAAPLGRGLGVTGTSTKLSTAESSNSVDSGIIARLIEMGLPGAAIQLSSFAAMLFPLFNVWLNAGVEKNARTRSVAAMTIAVVLALFSSQLSGDISGFLVLVLWLVLGLALSKQAVQRAPLLHRLLAPDMTNTASIRC